MEGHAGQRRKSRKEGKGMACRAEWEEFGKAGLGRKASMEGARKARKGRTELKGQGIVGQDRTGQDGSSGNAWESMVGLVGNSSAFPGRGRTESRSESKT